MRTLNVWLESSSRPIGRLIGHDDGAIDFAYTAAWLETAANHPISLSLPLTEAPCGDALARAFFGNLLQENDQLERVMDREGIGRGDIVGLLAYLGADCAGAISVLPPDHPPIKRPGDLDTDYDVLDDAAFRDIVARLATNRPLPDEVRDPSPVAGYRPKISLALLGAHGFGLPRAGSGAPTTHIVKIPDPDHPHEARDEAFVTLLAGKCGFPVGTCVKQAIGDHEILLIQRFDRIVRGSAVGRVHQEDFAQAAGLPASLKYERYGKPGRRFDAATIGAILAATDQPALSRARFLRMSLFNLLIGNNDNHAKNHALLHLPGASPMLAPFYDLVPVLTVPGFKPDLAFRIGAAETADAIGAADLERFVVDLGFAQSHGRHLLDALAREVIDDIEKLAEAIPVHLAVVDRQIGAVAAHLNAVLGLGMILRERDVPAIHAGGWSMS